MDRIEKMGVSCWIAPEQIPIGSNYAREIPQAIKSCDVFLLIVSKLSQESIWVEKEVDAAVRYRKKIIPVHIDEYPLNDMFQFYLNNIQMISYVAGKERGIAELERQFASLTPVQNMSDDREYKAKTRAQKADMLTLNPPPHECQYCGAAVEMVSLGVYRCVVCGKETGDYYQRVREYLAEHGATPAVVIARETGIPRKTIDHFFREEYLEIPSASPIRLACAKCGAPIRTGTICDDCKHRENSSNARARKTQSGEWHSGVFKR
jgi:ribosomal protein L37AE/L43A/ribosomal protein L32